ncbi:MAG: hypothetical protein JWQ35_1102 [Bacteriovoracaceae bacterium]|nr:hypothetical protein [Bacteriovoracaceae bacterium]
MRALLAKDFRNAHWAFPPALILGIPLLLILNFTQDNSAEKISWRSALWITFLLSSTSLFFRSFGLENRFNNFQVYTAFRIPKLQIFLSQALIHFVSAFLLGLGYLLFCILFWSPKDLDLLSTMGLLALASACLAPMGTLLGLMLQLEREFLFSVIYLPLATPVVLAAYSLSLVDASTNWLYVLISFLVAGGFISALIFEFFFDELSQSL